MNGHGECGIVNLCRFDPDCGSIVLEPVTTVSQEVDCDFLEDALDDAIDGTIEFPVEYPQQDDALLLHCRMPRPPTKETNSNNNDNSENAMASITGIPEEFGTPKINLSFFKGTISNVSNNCIVDRCSCHPPRSQWERQDLVALSTAFDRSQQRQQKLQPESVNMMWVDLRSCPSSSLFPNLTSVAHFMRSLLQTSHGASPWCPQENSMLQNGPRRIGVLFSDAAPDYLFDVRVGDICPSWSIYCITRIQAASSWTPWVSTTTSNHSPPAVDGGGSCEHPATLVVFKQLPPRPLMMLSPPPRIPVDESHLVELPKGCLWEVYFEVQEADEGSNDSDMESDPDEKKQAKKAVKIPHVRMTAPPYISYVEDYEASKLQPVLENWKIIRDEALQIPQWTAWPETQHYSKATSRGDDDDNNNNNDDPDSFHPSWTVFPLCHCFPANQVENKKWIEQTCALVPQTVHLLREHLGPVLRTALFSRLDPETTLEAHTGWSDLANHVMRCHLSLVVPPGQVCGTWVDGCVETHQEGNIVCFDDSKTHRAFNYSSGERIVLILDLARPEHLPKGTATGGHSDELDQFIAQMNI